MSYNAEPWMHHTEQGNWGFFGGGLEEGETPLEGLQREIAEETSLDPHTLEIDFLREVAIPAGINFHQDRFFYVYQTTIADENFEVYEGDGAEVFSLDEIRNRTDVIGSTAFIFAELTKSP